MWSRSSLSEVTLEDGTERPVAFDAASDGVWMGGHFLANHSRRGRHCTITARDRSIAERVSPRKHGRAAQARSTCVLSAPAKRRCSRGAVRRVGRVHPAVGNVAVGEGRIDGSDEKREPAEKCCSSRVALGGNDAGTGAPIADPQRHRRRLGEHRRILEDPRAICPNGFKSRSVALTSPRSSHSRSTRSNGMFAATSSSSTIAEPPPRMPYRRSCGPEVVMDVRVFLPMRSRRCAGLRAPTGPRCRRVGLPRRQRTGGRWLRVRREEW